MTPATFRTLALRLAGAEESRHMDHPDFRVNRKIFATLGYPGDEHAMVKLTPAEQQRLIKKAPGVFAPCAGKWGESGSTSVYLPAAKIALVRAGLKLAHQSAASVRRPRSR